MPERLDTQAASVRPHIRSNSRWMQRGYEFNPHSVWGDALGQGPAKGVAKPYNVYPPEATVTAQDSTNAAKLAGLGYVASPTSNWTVGQYISVGGFLFHHNGTIWVAGAHP